MSYTDFDYYSRVNEQTIPSDIVFRSETENTLTDSPCLNILDNGVPARATVAITLKMNDFPHLLDVGTMKSIFERKTGLGFRDQGFYYLSSGRNPLLDGVKGYSTHFIDGGTSLRVSKFTNGLHDPSSFTTLANFTTQTSGSTEHVVLQVIWYGGFMTEYSNFTRIETFFGSDTSNFEDLESFAVCNDSSSPYFIGHAGLWFRSRSVTEPLDSLIDDTWIIEGNII